MLCGVGAASMGVGRGGGLQGASAGLRGRQQRGRKAISSVCVEVQPPVSFAQRQIISFAKTGAFPPPETQGDRSRQRWEPGREGETEAELRKQTILQTCFSRVGIPVKLHGEPPASGSFSILKGGAVQDQLMQVCVTSAGPSTDLPGVHPV